MSFGEDFTGHVGAGSRRDALGRCPEEEWEKADEKVFWKKEIEK